MTNPIDPTKEPNHEPQKNPSHPPGEEQHFGQGLPDTEINPDKHANDTEIDLDKSKTKTYPPERH